MFKETVEQFRHVLENLNTILEKAKLHAEAKKFDANNYLTQRLAPDMFPLTRQVQIACDVAKGAAAAISGVEPPKHEDNETTLDSLCERIKKTQSFIKSIPAAKLTDVDPNRRISIPFPKGKSMLLKDSIVTRSTPNLYFHVSMTYAILRQAGVDIGKGDFLGKINILD
jgi:hypothetical protein